MEPFKCAKCSCEHPAVQVQRGTDATEEERTTLRQAWHKSIERLHAAPYKMELGDENLEEKVGASLNDAKLVNEIKACGKYLETVRWIQLTVPDTLVTLKSKTGTNLVCKECVPFVKKIPLPEANPNWKEDGWVGPYEKHYWD